LRRRAWELGVDLKDVSASGSAGRIMQADLDAHVAAHGAGTPGAARGVERNDEQALPVIGLRRRIALQMQESKRRIPHFSYVEEIDVTELEGLRAALNAKWSAERGRLTLLPLLMRALVLAVREFPQVNVRFDDEVGVVTRHGAVHLGIATDTRHGLVVPVVRHAEARTVWSMAAEMTRLAEAARLGRATRAELSGSTITISSLGALGGIVSTPVINRPSGDRRGQRIVERPMARGGAIVLRQVMTCRPRSTTASSMASTPRVSCRPCEPSSKRRRCCSPNSRGRAGAQRPAGAGCVTAWPGAPGCVAGRSPRRRRRSAPPPPCRNAGRRPVRRACTA